jgi:hypothetical protein
MFNEISSWVFVLIVFAVLVGIEVIRRLNKKYPKCGGKLKMEKFKDAMGFNISNKVTFSFYRGPRKYTETWRCVSCGESVNESYWGS